MGTLTRVLGERPSVAVLAKFKSVSCGWPRPGLQHERLADEFRIGAEEYEGKSRPRRCADSAADTTPKPEPEPEPETNTPTGPRRRANVLAKDRPALEAEVLRLCNDVAERGGEDPLDVMGRVGEWKGRRQVNPAAMSDDRLINVRLDLFKELRRLRGEDPEAPTTEPAEPPKGEQAAVDLWDGVLDKLRADVPPQSFGTWLQPTRGLRLDESTLTVWCPNDTFVGWIRNCWGDRLAELLAPVKLELIHGAAGGGA